MKPPSELTDLELSQELTACRQTLDAIRPYSSRAISKRQSDLWREYDLRRASALAKPQPIAN